MKNEKSYTKGSARPIGGDLAWTERAGITFGINAHAKGGSDE